MTATAPPQHMIALERAQRLRLQRAGLRREVHSYDGPDALEVGRAKVAQLLRMTGDDLEPIATMPVVQMLSWVRRLNRVMAVRYAAAADISEHRTVADATERQRRLLADLLDGGLEALREAEENRHVARWAAERNRRSPGSS